MQRPVQNEAERDKSETTWSMLSYIFASLNIPLWPVIKANGIKIDPLAIARLSKEADSNLKITALLLQKIREWKGGNPACLFLLNEVFLPYVEKNNSAIYTAYTAEFQKKIDVTLTYIFSALQQAKNDGEGVTLGVTVIAFIAELFDARADFCKSLSDVIDMNPNERITEANILITMCNTNIAWLNLLNSFYAGHIDNNVLKSILQITGLAELNLAGVLSHYRIIRTFILYSKAVEAESFLASYKKQLEICVKLDLNAEVAEDILFYHTARCYIDRLKGDFEGLKQNYIKAVYEAQRILEQSGDVSFEILMFGMESVRINISLGHFHAALFFARLINMLLKRVANVAQPAGDGKSADQAAQLKSQIKTYFTQIKEGIYRVTSAAIAAHFAEGEIEFSYSRADNMAKKFSMRSTHVDLSGLVRQFRLHGIICEYADNNNSKNKHEIVFEKILDTSERKIAKCIKSWQEDVKYKEETERLKSMADRPAREVTVSSTTVIVNAVQEATGVPAVKQPKRYQLTVDEADTPAASPAKPAKRIDWNQSKNDKLPVFEAGAAKKKVYKLHAGTMAKGLYIFVNPQLNAYLKNKYQAERVNLKAMLGVGHVLRNSQGQKGFLLSGEDFEESHRPASAPIAGVTKGYVKVKDASKDPRFFGRIVGTTKQNGKTYQLYEIDGFSPTHKDKPEYFSGIRP